MNAQIPRNGLLHTWQHLLTRNTAEQEEVGSVRVELSTPLYLSEGEEPAKFYSRKMYGR